MIEKDIAAFREKNLITCEQLGFSPSQGLPTRYQVDLRPALEIAKRLHAIKAIVAYVLIPPAQLSDQAILAFMKENELQNYLTKDEFRYLATERGNQDAINSIGWKFENAWPLAWYFGFQQVDQIGKMMEFDISKPLFFNFCAKFDEDVQDWLFGKTATVSAEELIIQADLFYCLHNAVRSAQLGSLDCVPDQFDPIGNGGVIHERRHAFTWMISKGVEWEQTDLST